MDINQITILASLVTGFATLSVAIFLAFQLKLQHRDSKKELELQLQERWDTGLKLIMDFNGSEGIDILTRGRKNLNLLKTENEKAILHMLSATSINTLMLKYSYGEQSGYDQERHIKEFLARSPGIRALYRDGRLRATFRDDHQVVLDKIVKSIDDEVGHDGILNLSSGYPH